jgi:hypothetical protein
VIKIIVEMIVQKKYALEDVQVMENVLMENANAIKVFKALIAVLNLVNMIVIVMENVMMVIVTVLMDILEY